MDHITLTALASWQNFYVIVGSSAGALMGLQFVVMTLVMQARAAGNIRDIHAFGTPTVIHFSTALLISACMTAPWQSLPRLGISLLVGGVAGITYAFRVLWHARRAEYKPDTEDWLWYVAFPLLAHCALLCAAVLIWLRVDWSLAAVAIDAVVFLLLGVHNSWDTVTFIAIGHANSARSEPPNS